MYRLVVVSALLGLPLTVRAGPLPNQSLRELTLRADTILLADALDPVRPTRFKVRAVLRGKGARVGEELAFRNMGGIEVESFDPPSLPKEDPRPRRVAQALLFLLPSKAELVPSGLRFLTDDQRVLVPKGRLVVQPDADWNALLATTRTYSASLNELDRARCVARPSARVRALLGWIERQRQLGAEEISESWGRLDRKVFDLALTSGSPEECWSAVKLYAERNRGAAPALPAGCVLAGPAGRALLLDQAGREDALRGDRLRALTLLTRAAPPMTVLEHQETLQRFLSMLATKDGPMRAALARAIVESSPAKNGARARAVKQVLPELVRLYKDEAPGATRDELAEAVYVLGGPEHWQKQTGHPTGALVCLRDLEKSDTQVRFWLSLHANGRMVHEQPVVVLERINLLGGTAETKRIPLSASNLSRPWAEGWDGADLLLVEVPLRGMAAGNWRITVHGTLGKEKQKWVAETKKIVIASPAGPRNRRYRDSPFNRK